MFFLYNIFVNQIINDMSTMIKCEKRIGSTNIYYLAWGTIGWLKTRDNEIRQCKCVGAKLKRDKCSWCSSLQYEWKVAGIKEHQYGTENTLSNGTIYTTEQYAQCGASNGVIGDGIMTTNRVFSLHEYLIRQYGLTTDCFKLEFGWNNTFTLRTYGIMKDHTIRLLDTDFDIIINNKGIDVVVPFLDNMRRYPTAEKAFSSMKPLKVYSLDDEDNDVTQPHKKIKVTIEIESHNLSKLKEIGVIVEKR